MTEAVVSAPNILIIEDVDHKFDDVQRVVSLAYADARVTRARTLTEAEQMILASLWDLVVLDISMDIAPGSAGPMRDGHANLGGMDLLEQMFLMEREMPTIIVTGFDYFVSSSPGVETRQAQTFGELERQAQEFIGAKLLGCIRYGAVDWQQKLESALGASTL